MNDIPSIDSNAQKRHANKQRQKKSRTLRKNESNWENNGFHKLGDGVRVKQETAEVLWNIAEKNNLNDPGSAIDLLVDTYNSDQNYSQAVEKKSVSAVTRDNRERRNIVHSINQEAANRLL